MKIITYNNKISLRTKVINEILKLKSLFEDKDAEYDPLKSRINYNNIQTLLGGALTRKVSAKTAIIEGVKTRLYTPKKDALDGYLTFHIHGGGYMHGCLKSYNAFCGLFSSSLSCRLIAFDYPLAPEEPFPAALSCIVNLYKFLAEGEFKDSKIIISGDSAGGGLALSAALKLRDEGFEKLPEMLLLFSPGTDLTLTSPYIEKNEKSDVTLSSRVLKAAQKHYTTPDNLKNPYVSQVFATFENFPPVFIQCSNNEMLYGDSLEIADIIDRDGGTVELNVWNDMPHAFIVAGKALKENRQALEQVKDFMKKYIS